MDRAPLGSMKTLPCSFDMGPTMLGMSLSWILICCIGVGVVMVGAPGAPGPAGAGWCTLAGSYSEGATMSQSIILAHKGENLV